MPIDDMKELVRSGVWLYGEGTGETPQYSTRCMTKNKVHDEEGADLSWRSLWRAMAETKVLTL